MSSQPQRITEVPLKIAPTVQEQVKQIFGNKAKVALAVFKHESGLNVNAINYNCIYNGKSTFCKKKDISKAHSVDCGIAQLNFLGKICPTESLTVEGNLATAKKMYDERGFTPWVSFTTGRYKKFL